jgi:hypothetical protein
MQKGEVDMSEELLEILNEWQDKIIGAIDQKSGKLLCESTRMIVSVLSILVAYFPNSLTVEIWNTATEYITDALKCTNELEKWYDPEQCSDLYNRNIQIRAEDFKRLKETWSGIPVR